MVANRPDYNGMLYEERGRRILAHTGEKVVIDPKGQPWVVGQFPLKAFKPGEWHDYRVLAEGNHHRHWIDGHPTVDVIDLDEKGRKLDGVLAVQVHVGPPMTIRYKDFFLKALPDDLPLIKPEQAAIPPDAREGRPAGPGQAEEARCGVILRPGLEGGVTVAEGEKLRLGKGSSFVKSHLSRLPRTEEVWEADIQPISVWGLEYPTAWRTLARHGADPA